MKNKLTNIIIPIIVCAVMTVTRPTTPTKYELVDAPTHMIYTDIRLDRNAYLNQ